MKLSCSEIDSLFYFNYFIVELNEIKNVAESKGIAVKTKNIIPKSSLT